MPISAKTPCRHAGCRALVDKPGHCDQHRKESFKAQKQSASDDYKERNRFYQRSAWKRVRLAHLQDEPLCRSCRKAGRLAEAKIVDHIIPITDGGDEYADVNLQSLCTSCHNTKTAGGW